MTLNELEEKLKRENLLLINDWGIEKKYRSLIIKEFTNYPDCFGIIDYQDGFFKFYITDSERGIPIYDELYNSIEETCDALYFKISRLKRIEQEDKEK